MSTYRLLQGDVRSCLVDLPAASVHTVICSPPYYLLRSYLPDAHPDKHYELGHEATPQEFIANLVGVFRAVWRVLRDDGTLWVNISDGWNAYNGGAQQGGPVGRSALAQRVRLPRGHGLTVKGTPNKSLHLIPQRFVIAMADAGWIVRQDLIWHKPAPMPSSATDRCTPAHEYIYLFSKKPRYYFDAVAIAEPSVKGAAGSTFTAVLPAVNGLGRVSQQDRVDSDTRNRRSVWRISTEPLADAHYAAFPTRLPELCLLAGTSAHGCCGACGAPWSRVVDREFVPQHDVCPAKNIRHANGVKGLDVSDGRAGFPRGTNRVSTSGWQPTCRCNAGLIPATVLDPFTGSGSTAIAALRNGRQFVGCELSEEYITIARRRIEASLHESNVLDRPKVKMVAGQMPLWDDVEAPEQPVKDKQSQVGNRCYTGFNARWKAAQEEVAL